MRYFDQSFKTDIPNAIFDVGNVVSMNVAVICQRVLRQVSEKSKPANLFAKLLALGAHGQLSDLQVNARLSGS
jgi:hypothetical protein